MRNKVLFFCLILLTCCAHIQAQKANNIYFMKHNPLRHELNPSFMPEEGFRGYLGFPAMTSLDMGFSDNSYIFNDLCKVKNGELVTVFDNDSDLGLRYLLTSAHKSVKLDMYGDVGLFNLGIKKNDTYWMFGAKTKFEMNTSLPTQIIKDILEIVDNGARNTSHKFEKFAIAASLYNEYSMGVAHKFGQITIGGKLKFLQGYANMKSDMQDLQLDIVNDHWKLTGAAEFYFLVNGMKLYKDGNSITVEDEESDNPMDLLKSNGYGLAMDLGANMKLGDRIRLSASVIDLGFIKWKQKANKLSADLDIEFDMPARTEDQSVGDYLDKLQEVLSDATDEDNYDYWVEDKPVSYRSMLSTKFYAGVEFSWLEDKMSASLLSKTWIYSGNGRQDLVLAWNARPAKFFDCVISYDILNGHFGSLGYGMNFNAGPINFFVTMDDIPLRYSDKIKSGGSSYRIPSHLSQVHFSMGLNFLIGWRKSDTETDKSKFVYESL
ncbi:MAG: hypothetical protein J6Y72_06825 [Bacteroidales bacterium]|nr:hypothetical protein [Bacteroidales bacterium]